MAHETLTRYNNGVLKSAINCIPGTFLNQNGLRIVRVEGPPSGQSTSVVVHYSVAEGATSTGKRPELSHANAAERAQRLTNGLKGLLSKELAEHGGAEAFVRWIRSDDKEAA
jgi:hypothetical protein